MPLHNSTAKCIVCTTSGNVNERSIMAKNSENTKLFTRKKDWTEIKVQGGNQEIENMLSSEFLGMKIYASAF